MINLKKKGLMKKIQRKLPINDNKFTPYRQRTKNGSGKVDFFQVGDIVQVTPSQEELKEKQMEIGMWNPLVSNVINAHIRLFILLTLLLSNMYKFMCFML